MDEPKPPEKKQLDLMRNLCIEQGYVPPTCTLNGNIVYMLVKDGEDPCAGCNMDRAVCKGRPRR